MLASLSKKVRVCACSSCIIQAPCHAVGTRARTHTRARMLVLHWAGRLVRTGESTFCPHAPSSNAVQGPDTPLSSFRREALGRRGELVAAGEEGEIAASQRARPNGVGPQARECPATPGRRAVERVHLQGAATFVVERLLLGKGCTRLVCDRIERERSPTRPRTRGVNSKAPQT